MFRLPRHFSRKLRSGQRLLMPESPAFRCLQLYKPNWILSLPVAMPYPALMLLSCSHKNCGVSLMWAFVFAAQAVHASQAIHMLAAEQMQLDSKIIQSLALYCSLRLGIYAEIDCSIALDTCLARQAIYAGVVCAQHCRRHSSA